MKPSNRQMPPIAMYVMPRYGLRPPKGEVVESTSHFVPPYSVVSKSMDDDDDQYH